jgi:arylsulfate sulfotransferase
MNNTLQPRRSAARRLGRWTLAPLVALAACNDSDYSSSTAPPSDTVAPSIVAGPLLAAGPNPFAPLAARLQLELDEPARLRLSIFDGDRTQEVEFDGLATVHDVPVLGVAAGRTADIDVILTDKAGNETSTQVQWVAPDLPANFPPLSVTVLDPDRMEPGLRLMPMSRVDPDSPLAGTFVTVIDDRGEVVWYVQSPWRTGMVERIDNGNLLVNIDNQWMTEIGPYGLPQQVWYADGQLDDPSSLVAGTVLVDTDALHHEIIETPDGWEGDFLGIGLTLQSIFAYPIDEVELTPADFSLDVAGDEIVEFKRDGTVVRRWSMFDLIDPLRLSYDSLLGFWTNLYGGYNADWTHGNGITYDADENLILVSLRHQEAIVAFDPDTSELVWILGDPARWESPYDQYLLDPIDAGGLGDPDFEWTYHQHAPLLTGPGRLMLFDNGNQRAVPPTEKLPDPNRYSRAVEFEIDRDNRTVRQIWEYDGTGGEGPWYSRALGDVDQLPSTGNILVTDGWRITTPDNDPNGPAWARIFEVTHEATPEIVFEATVRDPDPDSTARWIVYRGEWIPGLY